MPEDTTRGAGVSDTDAGSDTASAATDAAVATADAATAARETTDKEGESPTNPNDEIRETIYQKRREEIAAGADAPPTPPGRAAGADAAPGQAGAGSEDPLVTVKIHGDERQVPQSELVRGYQMETAGQEALRTARQRQRELDQREAQLRQWQAAAQASAQEAAQRSRAEAAALDDDEARKLAEVIQYGDDEEEVATAIKKVWQGRGRNGGAGGGNANGADGAGGAPTVHPEVLAAHVEDRVRRRMAYQQTLNEVAAEYPGIIGNQADPHLIQVAANNAWQLRRLALDGLGYPGVAHMPAAEVLQRYTQEQQRGRVWPDGDLFRRATMATQNWIDTIADRGNGSAPGSGNNRQDEFARRQQAKRAAATAPTSAGLRATIAPDAPPNRMGKTRSDVVQKFKELRGQAPGG